MGPFLAESVQNSGGIHNTIRAVDPTFTEYAAVASETIIGRVRPAIEG